MISLATLISQETKAALYQKALDVAVTVGLVVTGWGTGDPTRSQYHYLAEVFKTLEEIAVGYIRSGFLDLAAEWVTLNPDDDDIYARLVGLADEVYGYTATAATYATATVRLVNAGGGIYDIEAGDLTVKNSTTGATYHNTSGGVLASGGVTMSGAPNLTFLEVGATGDTITRSAGSWLTDGFKAGMLITVTGSVSNNIALAEIASLSATIITLGTTDLVNEGPVGGCTVTAATQISITVEADEAGSDSSSAAGDIDTMVTTLLDVTCTNTTAATGLDAESAASIVAGCRAKLGSLSPAGPADAYVYVATNDDLTSAPTITRARCTTDSTTGLVTTYIATATGAAAGADVTLVQAAINQWAAPLCITPTVTSASAVTVNVTYQLWIYDSVNETATEIAAAVQTALREMFAAQPIGGDVITPPNGSLYKSLVESTILGTYPDHAFRVSVSSPAADTTLTPSQVASLGLTSSTITVIAAP